MLMIDEEVKFTLNKLIIMIKENKDISRVITRQNPTLHRLQHLCVSQTLCLPFSL